MTFLWMQMARRTASGIGWGRVVGYTDLAALVLPQEAVIRNLWQIMVTSNRAQMAATSTSRFASPYRSTLLSALCSKWAQCVSVVSLLLEEGAEEEEAA